MRNLSDLQRYHLTSCIDRFYLYTSKADEAESDAEKREHKLMAAGMADDIVRRVIECDPDGGMAPVQIFGGNTVTLAEAERDAYEMLVWRAENSPNPFRDNGNRWFIANRLTRAGHTAHSGVFR